MEHTGFSSIEQAQAAPDYAKYDRVWQRVAPQLEPYAQPRESTAAMQVLQEPQPAAAESVQRELRLPGAQADPCCMGTEAAEMLRVLEGFAQEEGMNGSTYCQLARFAGGRAASALRALGRGAERRACMLRTIAYLITGEERQMSGCAALLPRLPLRVLLRDSYHAAACSAFNYARAAESAADVCLQRELRRFSDENYAAAEQILRILAQLR